MENKGTKGFRTVVYNENRMIIAMLWDEDGFTVKPLYTSEGELSQIQLEIDNRFVGNISCWGGSIEREPYHFKDGSLIIGEGEE